MQLKERVRAALDALAVGPLRKAATKAQIADLEKRWGVQGHALPPAYRAFLEITNGYSDGDGDGEDEHADPTIIGLFSARQLSARSAESKDAAEFQKGDPDDEVARRGIVIGNAIPGYVFLDPKDAFAVVVIDTEREQTRYADLIEYLEGCVEHRNAQSVSAAPAPVIATPTPALDLTRELRAVAFAKHGELVVSLADRDGHLHVWNAADGKHLRQIDNRLRGALATDGDALIATGDEENVSLLNLNGELLRSFERAEYSNLVFHERSLIGANTKKSIAAWNVDSGAMSVVIDKDKLKASPSELSISADGKVLVFIEGNRAALSVLDRTTNALRRIKVSGKAYGTALRADGAFAVVCCGAAVDLVRLTDDHVESQPAASWVQGAAFSSAEDKFASWSSGTIELWTIEEGGVFKRIKTLAGAHQNTSVCFSPTDGQMLAEAGKGVKIWNLE